MSGAAQAPAGQPPRTGRFVEFIRGVPLVTLSVLLINVIVYVADNLGDYGKNIATFAIQPVAVIERWELYRIISAAFVHGGLMHIGMNMMSLYQLGSGLEPLFGSLQYAFVLAVFTVAIGSLYVAMGWLLSLYDPAYLYSSAVGFSGVLFAMAVDEVSLSPFPTRSVFGLFSVPTKLYPWVLMLLLQFLLPNVSLLGHLAGVIIGFIHTWGGFKWAIPSLVTLRKLEQARWFQPIVRLGPYKLVPAQDVLRSDMSVRGQIAQACSCLSYVLQPLADCLRRRSIRLPFGIGGADGAAEGRAGAGASQRQTGGTGATAGSWGRGGTAGTGESGRGSADVEAAASPSTIPVTDGAGRPGASGSAAGGASGGTGGQGSSAAADAARAAAARVKAAALARAQQAKAGAAAAADPAAPAAGPAPPTGRRVHWGSGQAGGASGAAPAPASAPVADDEQAAPETEDETVPLTGGGSATGRAAGHGSQGSPQRR